ncbi:MAG: AAA family ATPase [Gammaproteobacteria bacterium]
MIRINSVQIEEFRGIRKLTLAADGQNFGICGPNGTGKSGVVDAIEFCLTGDVTRLSGTGTAGITVRKHAPHVDRINTPSRAKVTIEAFIPSLNKNITVERSVDKPSKPVVAPKDAGVQQVIEELQTHPEFALSRREIVKYIITPPNQRATDVQTLLRLERLEQYRKSLNAANNAIRRKSDADQQEKQAAILDFAKHFGLDKPERDEVLKQVNEHRQILGLQPLAALAKDTSFKEGVAIEDGDEKDATKVLPLVKTSALKQIKAVISDLCLSKPEDLQDGTENLLNCVQTLNADEKALLLARRHGFFEQGLEFCTEDKCPLCDTAWNPEELKKHIEDKLLSSQEMNALLASSREASSALVRYLSDRIKALESAEKLCISLSPPVVFAELKEYADAIKQRKSHLTEFSQDPAKIAPLVADLETEWWSPSNEVRDVLSKCQLAIEALPEDSPDQVARDFLVKAEDRYAKVISTTAKAKKSKKNADVMARVLAHYNETSSKVLETIYDTVADDFSHYYRLINHEDEAGFRGELSSAPAKLNFDVDFYGRGLFPPGAYHSEGHQDGMGLCLYLALMKHTLGDRFTFAVLDDVLMSVDTGHRKEVCRLLKTEFPKTQFILTTHDRVWLQYMKTEGLIGKSQQFSSWSVDSGPRIWDDTDVWAEIDAKLGKNDVSGAAHTLRRYLEYISSILADSLRAPVEYRGDARYDLGQLFPPTIKKWRKLLEKGEKAAKYWKKDEDAQRLKTVIEEAATLVDKANTDNWAINPSVHFNEWENFEPDEFKQVSESLRELLARLQCQEPVCRSFVYLTPKGGTPEALRCNCGSVNINLKAGS